MSKLTVLSTEALPAQGVREEPSWINQMDSNNVFHVKAVTQVEPPSPQLITLVDVFTEVLLCDCIANKANLIKWEILPVRDKKRKWRYQFLWVTLTCSFKWKADRSSADMWTLSKQCRRLKLRQLDLFWTKRLVQFRRTGPVDCAIDQWYNVSLLFHCIIKTVMRLHNTCALEMDSSALTPAKYIRILITPPTWISGAWQRSHPHLPASRIQQCVLVFKAKPASISWLTAKTTMSHQYDLAFVIKTAQSLAVTNIQKLAWHKRKPFLLFCFRNFESVQYIHFLLQDFFVHEWFLSSHQVKQGYQSNNKEWWRENT